MIKNRWNEFKFRLKIFMWFMGTEPLRIGRDFGRAVTQFFRMFNKTLTYSYLFFVMAIIAFFMGDKPYAGILLIILLFSIIMWEWQRGLYMKRWRDYQKKKIKKMLEEQK